jgi:hypothetical protein
MLAFGTHDCGFEPGRSHRIFRAKKIHSVPSFRGEVKPPVPDHRFAACKRTLWFTWELESQAKLTGQFLPIIPSFTNRGISCRLTWSASGGDGQNWKAVRKGPAYRPRCDGVVAPWPRPQSYMYAKTALDTSLLLTPLTNLVLICGFNILWLDCLDFLILFNGNIVFYLYPIFQECNYGDKDLVCSKTVCKWCEIWVVVNRGERSVWNVDFYGTACDQV